MKVGSQRPSWASYLSSGRVVAGILVGKDQGMIVALKDRIEKAVRIAGDHAKNVNFSTPQMIYQGQDLDKKILDACSLIRMQDILYLPVNVIPEGNLRKILPPGYFKMNLVELVTQNYNQCKVDALLESALVCDLTLFPGRLEALSSPMYR